MSRFVSAGTDPESVPKDEDGWQKARQEVAAQRTAKVADAGQQEGGKSLYEVLQANKAAKQEAFEESIRLKNQFRALDDDEVDFLDSVLESSRAKDQAVKQETAQQLEEFRKQQRAAAHDQIFDQSRADEGAGAGSGVGTRDTWATHKKKRRRKDSETEPPSKLRKARASEETTPNRTSGTPKPAGHPNQRETGDGDGDGSPTIPARDQISTTAATAATAATIGGLGLDDYASDDDD